MHSITLNQNWKIVRVTLDPPQSGPSRKCNEPILGVDSGPESATVLQESTVLTFVGDGPGGL